MAGQQEKPINELLSRDMVDIYVGQENTQWVLHEKLLCHRSKFFDNVFHGEDNKDKTTSLPDEEDEPFRMFVGWLYSGLAPPLKEEKDLNDLFDLYLMGEKWQIKSLQLEVLKSVRNFYRETDTYPALRRVQYIYANTEIDSPMRQLLISSVARNLVTSREGMAPQWDKALRKNGQLAVDIIIAMQKWNLEKDTVPDAREEPVQPILDESEQAKESKQNGEQGQDEEEEEEEGNDEEQDDEDAEEGDEQDEDEQQPEEQDE